MSRRFVLAIVFIGWVSATAAYAEEAKGVVYNDANGNGIRDAREQGISGVLVSNAQDIVTTDREGRYSIPISDDAIVFVIKPSGWMTPVGPGSDVPRFYYVHKPNGSPKMKYAGVAPTGPLPSTIDFPLRRQKEGKRFRVICMGDTQTRDVEEVQFLAHDILDELRSTDAVFGMTLGDNVFNDLTVFEPLVETMSGLGIPWRYVPGNHDHNHDAPTVDATDDSFERVFGPSYYSFNYGSVHFIVLNDIRHEAGKEEYHAGLGERQFAFVKNDLAHVNRKQLVVLTMHIPIMEIDEARALYDLLKDFPHTFSLSAHTHEQQHVFIGKKEGWQQDAPHHHLNHGTACGCWWGGNFDEVGIPMAQMGDGGPNNYSIITLEGTKYDVDFRVPRRPAGYQMNIWLPERIKASDAPNTEAVVNVFAGSSKSSVEMRLDNASEWKPMSSFTGQDPYLVEALKRQNAFVDKMAEIKGGAKADKAFRNRVYDDFSMAMRRLSGPDNTSHLWKANLTAGLAAGCHTLTVRTVDMFGRAYSSSRLFVVE